VYPGRGQMSSTSSDDGGAYSHARHLIYYVGMRYRSVVICKDYVRLAAPPLDPSLYLALRARRWLRIAK